MTTKQLANLFRILFILVCGLWGAYVGAAIVSSMSDNERANDDDEMLIIIAFGVIGFIVHIGLMLFVIDLIAR